MFTGLVEKVGTVESILKVSTSSCSKLTISADNFEVDLGDSVAINGCCLTVSSFTQNQLAFDVSDETLSCSELGNLTTGSTVNLERALLLNTRLGGHLVSGHVDGRGEVSLLDKSAETWLIEIKLPISAKPYLIHKGSICIDGVSLTINKLTDNKEASYIELTLIPTSIKETNLKNLQVGNLVNIEYDLVGKYIQRNFVK